MTSLLPPAHPLPLPRRPVWTVPCLLLTVSVIALSLAELAPGWAELWYFVPYTFLGNSLAPLPYDGAVVYLGARYPIWAIVPIGVAATLAIEAWNMELLARMLARDGTEPFRNHRITQGSLRWYRKAPFWSLVLTCVLPIVPHYPMRILAVLAGYPMWKYQTSVVLGRGARYIALVLVGATLPIPGSWILVASLIILAFGVSSARRMNRRGAEAQRTRAAAVMPEEA